MSIDDHGSDLGLAPLFPLAGFDGSLGEYIDRLYARYCSTVHEAGLDIWGLPLVAGDRRASDGRDATFWHIITSSTAEKVEQTRRLDLERCALVPRVCDVLERLADESLRVYWWQEPKAHILATPADFSVIVMVRRVCGTYKFVTAWPAAKPHERRRTFERAAARWALCGPQYFQTPGRVTA
jgi:hypothetical protein